MMSITEDTVYKQEGKGIRNWSDLKSDEKTGYGQTVPTSSSLKKEIPFNTVDECLKTSCKENDRKDDTDFCSTVVQT